MRGNTITLNMARWRVEETGNLYQYDYGQRLIISGVKLPASYEVHFSNHDNGVSKTVIGDETGVDIPDEYLVSGDNIHVWIFLHDGTNDGETEYHGIIRVTKRAKPIDVEPTPEQQDVITQAIAALAGGVEQVESIAEGIPQTINDALEEAKESGEFKGEKGDPGERGEKGDQGIPGVDGVSPVVSVESIAGGHSVTISDASGDHEFDVMNGLPGPKGDTGAVGTTFTPNVDEQGIISWTNDGGKQNPPSMNIKGNNGDPGEDGFSPVANVTKSGKVATITITDKNGTTSAQISDGTDGQDGDDGFSPTASVSKSGKTATITITDKNGTTTATVSDGENGEDGQDGEDGHSPVLTASKSGKTTTIYADGEELAEIRDGEDGQGTDVIDDTAGAGDTDKTWSADKVVSELGGVQDLVALPYEELTFPVAMNALCVHDGKLYKSIQAIQTEEAWTPSHWYDVTGGKDVTALYTGLDNIGAALAQKYTKPQGGIPASDLADGVIPDVSGKADKSDTVLDTTLSHGRNPGGTVGSDSVAYGSGVIASGVQSQAFGGSTTASGSNSHAEGGGSTASGVCAHSEGGGTTASGNNAHSEGGGTRAIGSESHAEGAGTTASGSAAHSEGSGTTAGGSNSHAEGGGTIASHKAQHAGGEWNVADPSSAAATARGTYVEIIGNGTAYNAKSNARTLDWSGNERLAGDLYVECNNDSTGGKKVATVNDIPDPADLIDDTAGAGDTGKVWSADKSASEKSSTMIALNTITPSEYSSSSTYAVGDLCWHENKMYRCNTAISTAEEWTAAHWTQIAFPRDVRVNGTTVVDANGVANVPEASADNFGVVKVAVQSNGLQINSSNFLAIVPATSAKIKQSSDNWKVLTPYSQHESVFYGLAKLAGADMASSSNPVGTFTESAKSAISTMLNGAVSVSGTTPSITALAGLRYVCGEVATLTIVVPATGIIDVSFESGSTSTVLTVTPPTGMTMRWIGDDPTALEANKHYEINIADGCNGMVVSWT